MMNHNLAEYVSLTFLVASIFCLTCLTRTQSISAPAVNITQGTLRGTTRTTRHNRTISAFLGIPYAQPPIGNLRFANPLAADGWNGTRDASQEGNQCPQLSTWNEDCLYLNVFSPQLPENTSSSLLPVMVWIHGGGFVGGSSTTTIYNPDYLLDEDVVMVSLNYRLGPLGFLSTGDQAATGNWGLKDQILALKWVQSNIRSFGGDPDQVTLFGESAGAASVHLLTLSNATQGLFHKYITQSGSALAPWAYQPSDRYAARAFQLGEYVNCLNNTSDALINCLRKVNASEILASYPRFLTWREHSIMIWTPTDEPDIEGAALTDSPANLFAAGKVRDLPYITGVVREEGLIYTAAFYHDENVFAEFLEHFDSLVPVMMSWTYEANSGAAWVDAIKSYYFNNNFIGNTSELLSNTTIFFGDGFFLRPAYTMIQQQSTLGTNNQYFYTFNYRGSVSSTSLTTGTLENYGIAHGDDLLYLFSMEPILSSFGVTLSEADYEMVDAMVQLWTSFAINSIPTSAALRNGTTWVPYSSADNYLQIGNDYDTKVEMQYSFHAERMQFWANLEATTTNPAPSGASTVLKPIPFLLLMLLLFSSNHASAAKNEIA